MEILKKRVTAPELFIQDRFALSCRDNAADLKTCGMVTGRGMGRAHVSTADDEYTDGGG